MEEIKVLEDPDPPDCRGRDVLVAAPCSSLSAFVNMDESGSYTTGTGILGMAAPSSSYDKYPILRSLGRATSVERNPLAETFRRRFHPHVSVREWNDWRWQLRNRIKHVADLERFFELSTAEREALTMRDGGLPVAITPYYASLLAADDPSDSLRRTMIPVIAECVQRPEEAEDPLDEESDSPVPGLVHRYPDRALFLVTGACAAYCRYCTRSRTVGCQTSIAPSRSRWERALDYIRGTPQIRDVIVSGGDPLTMSDDSVEWILRGLRAIPHVEIIRIGSKVPAVLPQRITPALTRMLKRFHPLWMSLHFTHPDELTPECGKACAMLADAGIPLGSQTVLLRGVNDDVPTMTRLMQGLLRFRVRPYYIYQCDPVAGSGHFRTPVETGLEIIRGLRGFTSGYAVPQYVIDAPGGGGKIPLLPDYVDHIDETSIHLRNYAGNLYQYPRAVSGS